MARTFSDLSALKSLKKEMEECEAPSEKAGKPARKPVHAKVIRHLTKDEERARNIGIVKGMTVRLMDTNDEGVIVAIGKDFYTVEIDGLPMNLVRSEFVIVDKSDDRRMISTVPQEASRIARKGNDGRAASSRSRDDLTVDLHIERIPGNESVPEWATLEYQIEYFRKIIRDNLKYKGRRIIFIHGDGDGTLRAAIRRELDEAFALSCTYNPAPAEIYGTGATTVTIR